MVDHDPASVWPWPFEEDDEVPPALAVDVAELLRPITLDEVATLDGQAIDPEDAAELLVQGGWGPMAAAAFEATREQPVEHVQLQDGRLLTVVGQDDPEIPEAVVWSTDRRRVKPVMVRVGRHGMKMDGEGCLPRMFGRVVMGSDWAWDKLARMEISQTRSRGRDG